MSTTVATATSTSIDLKPTLADQLPATVPPSPAEPAAPPKPSWLQDAMASDAGVGLKRWMNGVGAALGHAVPSAIMLGSTYVTCNMPESYKAVGIFGAIVSIGGSVLQSAYQGWDGCGAIDIYRKAGHPNPRWASFRDVMGYLVLPATTATALAATFVSPGWGIMAGTLTGLAGMSLALTTHQVRLEKYAPAQDA